MKDTMEVNCSEDFGYNLTREKSQPLGDSMDFDFMEEQEIFPRIGDGYQVGIPAVLEKCDYFHHERGTFELKSHALHYFLEVSVPVTSINREDKKLKCEATDKHAESAGVEFTSSDYDLVPGSVSDSWNDADKAGFRLGLYIFSRNFVRIKQFLESKKMEDILSFYYGEFYKSHEYCQWSETRKIRKKGVVGQKIFTGQRQQELLSRILPSLSDETKNATLELCKKFGEGKIAFEEFIFSLKEIVGISALVEGICIGKGKQDLTTMVLEPSRSNKVIPVVLMRKPCSSLTPNEIVKCLNGGCRLSKARSNDLFWEAVWPRLLARGWHSEEPKGQVFNTTGLKNSLVFLVPGIMKFSRRKLKKGEHYFGSINDVLNIVASDPSLLKLENDEEHETKSEDDDTRSEKRNCYLKVQPRTTNSSTEGLKFTVVDTGFDDVKPYKVTELSGLSFDINHKEKSLRYNKIIEEPDAVDSDTLLRDEVYTDDSEGSLRNDGESVSVVANETENKHIGNDEKVRDVMNFQLSNDIEEDKDNSHCISPAIKRRRLTACNNAEQCNDVISMPEIPAKLDPENHDMVERLHCSSTITTQENDECGVISNSDAILDSQIRKTFDLNLPPDCENESSVPESNGGGEHDEVAKGQLNDVNHPQRRGTRIRPPTARALEAVACGFLSMNTRQKGKTGNLRKKSTSRRSQRARGGTEELSDVKSNPVVATNIQENQSDPSSDSNRTELRDSEVLPEENRTPFINML